VARRKQIRRPRPPSDAEILEQLLDNFYAVVGLQSANAKSTEEKFTRLPRKEREKVKHGLLLKFAELRSDQKTRLRKRKRSRTKKTRKSPEK